MAERRTEEAPWVDASDGEHRLPAESGEFLINTRREETGVDEELESPRESVAPSWTRCASDYECFAEQITRPFAEDAARLVHITPESLVLDVGAGTGEFAMAAAQRGADVLATDFSPRMLDLLVRVRKQRKVRGIVPALMDGQNLQLASNQYHVAGSLFGLVFFPDPALGLSELHRVLCPGGQAVIGTWANPARVELMRVVGEMVMQVGQVPSSKASPSQWVRYSRPETLADAMRTAGFRSVHVVEVAHVWTFARVETFASAVLRMTPAWMDFHDAMTNVQRKHFAELMAENFRARQGEGPYAVTAQGLIAVGTKSR